MFVSLLAQFWLADYIPVLDPASCPCLTNAIPGPFHLCSFFSSAICEDWQLDFGIQSHNMERKKKSFGLCAVAFVPQVSGTTHVLIWRFHYQILHFRDANNLNCESDHSERPWNPLWVFFSIHLIRGSRNLEVTVLVNMSLLTGLLNLWLRMKQLA
jgi:hypothetical protein